MENAGTGLGSPWRRPGTVHGSYWQLAPREGGALGGWPKVHQGRHEAQLVIESPHPRTELENGGCERKMDVAPQRKMAEGTKQRHRHQIVVVGDQDPWEPQQTWNILGGTLSLDIMW